MKITKIILTNFRSIRNVEIIPDPHINLIVGVNGAGKSTILDAISMMLSWVIARIKNVKGKGNIPSVDDILQNAPFSEIKVQTDIAGEWTLVRKSPSSRKPPMSKTDFSEMKPYVDNVTANLDSSSIPAFVYYQVNRSVMAIPLRVRKHKKFDILDTYENSLEGAVGFRSFFEWYREREDLENENFRYGNNRNEDPQLKAVRTALLKFFPEYQNVRIQRNPLEMIIEKNGKKFNIGQLSDGEKCYISLICDLSRRLAIANPGLENPLDGEGIILIDELELHLHPSWQQEAIEKLKNTFPNCQFFITTHSPHIVSDIHSSQLILMKNGERLNPGLETYGKLITLILTDYFGIQNPRNITIQANMENLARLLKSNDFSQFNTELANLEKLLGKNDPDIISLKLEAIRKQRFLNKDRENEKD